MCRLRLKCDGTRVETRFRLSAKQTSPFKSAGAQFIRLLAAEVVMLDTPCSEVVRRVLDTHSIRQFPLHFPSRASPWAITFQLDSTSEHKSGTLPLGQSNLTMVVRIITSVVRTVTYFKVQAPRRTFTKTFYLISGKMALSIPTEWESVKLKKTEALRTCEQIL